MAERQRTPQLLPQKQEVHDAPDPTSDSTQEGIDAARSLSRRYLPDVVRLLAGVALHPDTDAAVHTRVMAAKSIIEIAGGMPQAFPEAPPLPPGGNSFGSES